MGRPGFKRASRRADEPVERDGPAQVVALPVVDAQEAQLVDQLRPVHPLGHGHQPQQPRDDDDGADERPVDGFATVSYTHLTLPTIYSV